MHVESPARWRHSPPLREQLEEHDAQRDVDEEHEDHQLLPGEPVLEITASLVKVYFVN